MPLAVRSIERSLVCYAVVLLWTGLVALYLAGNVRDIKQTAILAFLASVALLVSHFLLTAWRVGGDQVLFPLASVLTVSGLLVILRLSPEFANRQFVWLIVGLAVYLLTVKVIRDYKTLEDYQYIYILAGLLLLAVTIMCGTEAGGARSWISIGSFRMQPSELVKIILVVFLAAYLEEKKEVLAEGTGRLLGIPVPGLQYTGPLLVMWGFSLILLIFQNDLGTALIFFGTFLAMIYMATGRWSYVVVGAALFLIGAGLCYLAYDHVQVRVAIWLDPWKDIDGKGYQIVQSLFAIGSGGFYGTGLGLGHPDLIPAVHTDFVFSAWSEETGFLGASALLLLYCLLVHRGFRIALRAKTGFGSLLAAGLTALMAVQTLVIVGGVIKLLPLTGVTLPFVSYGGSSLVSSFLLLGLLTNISAKDGA